MRADVSDEQQVAEMVRKSVDAFGSVDIAINNAHMTNPKTLQIFLLENGRNENGLLAWVKEGRESLDEVKGS